MLIRALACLPHAHLVIAGAGAKDDAFHELAVTLGIEGRLHMLGALQAQEIADLYAACDLFVFPSIWETFGLAAAEAAMAGLPMVVADLPVLREVLNAGGTEPVTFVAPRNVEGWIAAIGTALAAPPAAPTLSQFRTRDRTQIFAAADDRELSEPVRSPSAAAASRHLRLAAGGGRVLMRRAWLALAAAAFAAAFNVTLATADSTLPAFKHGATLVEFFEFPAITGDGAARAYAVPAFPHPLDALEAVRLRRTASRTGSITCACRSISAR